MVGAKKFKVASDRTNKFVIDLDTQECSCRKWQLTGIPCCHAISSIYFCLERPEDYIPTYFRREAYITCYEPIINPTNGTNMWPTTNFDDILPPKFRVPTGRPKNKRRKEVDEKHKKQTTNTTKMSRKGGKVKCWKCGTLGNNARSCNSIGSQSSLGTN